MSESAEQDPCPTCGRPFDPDPMATIRHTAEFAVPQFSHHEVVAAPSPSGSPAAAPGMPSCSWCGKPGSQVKKLLSGGTASASSGAPGVHICNECVALCYMILRDELPDFA